ncbi:MAG: 50S ribosomal protein L4 [Candidatus Heimdallarchaeota archaeon]|nr:50S ribosomal protein L4 [Candidatus Heimdallarchaeota archaeon]
MKAKVLNLNGDAKKDQRDLPPVFEVSYRPDLIKRAVLSEQSKMRQKQGRYPLAGRMVAATSVGPGRGISKVPRTHARGTHHGNRAAFVHSARGGKLAFPPKVEKKIVEKINKKEQYLALKSAVSSTTDKDLVLKRGHKVEEVEFPVILDNSATEIKKSSEVIELLDKIGFGDDVERCRTKTIRAGKGKFRGRKHRRKIGPLIVVKDECDLMKAGRNIAGVEIVRVRDLKVETLAPGTNAGRATIWTESAIDALEEWN